MRLPSGSEQRVANQAAWYEKQAVKARATAAGRASQVSAEAVSALGGLSVPGMVGMPSPQMQTAQQAADAMDHHHEASLKAFPAKTQGLGGQPLSFRMYGSVKVFELTAKKVNWEVRPGEFKDAFSYDGVLPGPEVRVTEGETVRFIVKNDLAESTSVHWHGLNTPNAMDGVPYLTRPPIKPARASPMSSWRSQRDRTCTTPTTTRWSRWGKGCSAPSSSSQRISPATRPSTVSTRWC